jgi:hypothetical protein
MILDLMLDSDAKSKITTGVERQQTMISVLGVALGPDDLDLGIASGSHDLGLGRRVWRS